jgi:integrase
MKKWPYVQSFNGYSYLRYKGQPRVKLDGEIGSPAFVASYRRALAEAQVKAKKPPSPTVKKSLAVGTLRTNVDRYLASAMFKALQPGTQRNRRCDLNRWCDGRKLRDGSRLPGYGHLRLADITPKAFAMMMYARERTPGAQRSFLGSVRHFLKDCKKAQAVSADFDPTRDQHCGRGQNPEGIKCWPPEIMLQYRVHWPIGTMPRFALELLYETGAACVDAVKLGPHNIVDGLVVFDRQKTGTRSYCPLTPALERELAAAAVVTIAGPWLRTRDGKPFDPGYFGERLRNWAAQAGIPKGYTAHGIRKRAATDDANAGRTAHELMAKYGWDDIDQAAHYTRSADKKRLAMAMAERIRTGTEL